MRDIKAWATEIRRNKRHELFLLMKEAEKERTRILDEMLMTEDTWYLHHQYVLAKWKIDRLRAKMAILILR